jgi:hypothetical protein
MHVFHTFLAGETMLFSFYREYLSAEMIALKSYNLLKLASQFLKSAF